jgi:alkanesulfonate monooxygenase SsuD/methylene tetrahydromethanopterin reductase-like flavin-dependent oxidoreductase (luciferase family)
MLDTWASLTWLATATRRIRFGPLVRPLTFLPVVVGRSTAEVSARCARARERFSRLPEDEAGWCGVAFLHGSPPAAVEDLRRWEVLGVGRVMLQLPDMNDLETVDLLAREVVHALR